MPSVDDRIVRIEFDNSSFERKVDATLHSLAQLDKALQLEGAAAGLENVDKAAKGINLSSIAENVDHIASRFSALGAIGFSAIQKLTQGIMGFGATIARHVGTDILEPIITGGKQRALNLEQARFMFEGMGADVNKSMASAKEAVLGTAYGLDEAAKTAAQLGASGINAGDEMTGALKGIAGTAAMTNSSFSEMADVFTQAAGAGKISGYTLERISYRGLNAAAALAKQMGKSEAQIREMASKGQIDFKTFAHAMDQAFGAHAQEANKTFTGSLANLHAAMSRMGAVVFTPHLEQMRDLFNAVTPQVDNLTKALTPLLDTFTALARLSINKLIQGIKGLDFKKNVLPSALYLSGALKNVFILLNQIRVVASKAFKEIFPGSVLAILPKFTKAIYELTKHLTLSSESAKRVGSIFKGIFSILSIGWTIVKEGIKFFAGLLKSLLGFSGPGVLDFFAKIGDFFTDLQKGLVKGKGIQKFFIVLGDVLQAPIRGIREFAQWIGKLFTGFDVGKAGKIVDSTGRVGQRFQSLYDTLKSVSKGIANILSKIWDEFKTFATNLGSKLADAFSSGNFNKVLDVINTGLLAGIVVLLEEFFRKGLKIKIGGNFLDKITAPFTQLTGVLKAMQTQLKAKALKEIAIALGILTLSIIALSLIDSAALTKALTAMTVGFGQLIGVMALLDKINISTATIAKFALLAGGFTLMAGAMVLLADGAVKLGGLDWNGLAKGLVGTTILLGIMIGVAEAAKKLDLNNSLIKTGVSLVILGFALNIMAGAVKIFATMSWGDMAKGLLGVSVSLAILGGAVKLMPKGMLGTSLGVVAIAGALMVLGLSVKMFANMDWGSLSKGFIGVAVGLGLLVGAMKLMPTTSMLSTGAGLLLVSVGLLAIAKSMEMISKLSWGDLAKGLVGIAAALLVLAIAANAMQGAIVGAAAIAIVSASMVLLATAVKMFAGLGIAQFATAIVMIAVSIGVLAAVAVGLSEAIPFILALGVALGVVGLAFALFGVGAYLVAKAFEALAKAGEKGSKALVASLKAAGEALPALAAGFAKGLLDLAALLLQGFGKLVPLIVDALGKLLDGLSKLIPKVVKLMGELLDGILKLIVTYYPKIILAGVDLILNFLKGIRDKLPEIVKVVGEIITGFLDELANQIPQIIASVVNLIKQVLEGVARGMGELAATLWIGLGVNFVKGFMDGLNQELPGLTTWFTDLVPSILGWIGNVTHTLWQKGVDFITGLFGGITNKARDVINWFLSLARNILTWIGNVAATLFGKGFDFISGLYSGVLSKARDVASWFGSLVGNVGRWVGSTINSLFWKGWDFISGLFKGITDKAAEVFSWFQGLGGKITGAIGSALDTLKRVGNQIMEGMWNGIRETFTDIVGWIGSQIGKLADPIKKFFHLKSPSLLMREWGGLIMEGLQIGLEENFDSVISSVATFLDEFSSVMDVNANPVITPVLDLTQVQAEAAKIPDYISANPLTVTASAAQAKAIASTQAKTATAPDTSGGTSGVIFNQTINAPEQLSTADIYKQTRNQITMAKEELSIP